MINGKTVCLMGEAAVQIELITEAQNPNWFKRLRRAVGRLLPRCEIGCPSTTRSRIKRAAWKLEASQFDRERYDTAAHNSLGRPRIELGAERERLLQVFDEDPHFGRRPAACRSNRKDWHSPFIRS
jgi:hypothetical protein